MNQTLRPKEEKNPHRVGDLYFKENFGLLKIDWSKPEPNVAIEIRDLKGDVVRSTTTILPGGK